MTCRFVAQDRNNRSAARARELSRAPNYCKADATSPIDRDSRVGHDPRNATAARLQGVHRMRSTNNRAAVRLFLATLFIAGATRVLGAEPVNTSVDELRNAIAAGKYDDLAGDYQLSAYVTITVTREGKQLFGQAGGGQYLDLVPESADHFV